MNLQKKNNSIIFLILIIIILIVLLIGAVIISFRIIKINQNNNSDLKYRFDLNGENYSKENLIEFLEKAEECKNYSFEFFESGNLVSGCVYNNKIHYSNNYEDTYYNYLTKEMVIISNKDKTYKVLITDLGDKYKNILGNIMLSFLESDNSKAKFIKNENYNGFECIVEKIVVDDMKKVEEFGLFTTKQIEALKAYDSNKIKISYEFWIDQKTGLIPKYDIVIESVDKKENRIEYDTNLKVGEVKQIDVIVPTEDSYKDYEIIK